MNGKSSFLQVVEKELPFVTPTLRDPFWRKQKTDFLLKVREHFLWQAWHPNSSLRLWLKLYRSFVFFFFFFLLWISSSACEILLSLTLRKKVWLWVAWSSTGMAKLSQTKGPSSLIPCFQQWRCPGRTRKRQACNDDTPEYTPLVEKSKAWEFLA